jgi:hypothetical protein
MGGSMSYVVTLPNHRIIVGFDLGSCNPICFQTRGLKGAKMNISANYMAILFFI